MRDLTEVTSSLRASGSKPVLTISREQPGYLDLPSDTLDRLICTEPIEKHYDVEDQPFARGKFAAVRKCTHRKTGETYAAKFLRKRRRSTELRAEIVHEVAVLEACAGCPRVVRLHHVFESDAEMILLLELAPGGELQMLLDQDEVPEERQVARLMRQILDGVCYLHSINVAHLDIKPQNLVLTGEYPECDVKLCDFGISRYISHGADIREILGTPDYVAPEVLNYEPISLATDMWSVGVLVYVLLTGCSPFGGDTKQETFCNISQCKLDFPDDLFEEISEEAKDLISKLLVKDPSKRLSATECQEHVWFSSLGARVPSTTSTPVVTPITPVIPRKVTAVPVAQPRVTPTQQATRVTPTLQATRVTPTLQATRVTQTLQATRVTPTPQATRVTPIPTPVPQPRLIPTTVTSRVKSVPAVVATSITKVTTCVSEIVKSPTPIIETSQPVSKSVPSIKTSLQSPFVHHRTIETVKTTPVVPLSIAPPLPSTPPPLPSTPPPSLSCSKKNGIVSDRKSLFKKNMESLVQLIDTTTTAKTNPIKNDKVDKVDNNITIKSSNNDNNINNNDIRLQSTPIKSKTSANHHTMPANYRHQFGPSNLFNSVLQGNSVSRRTDESVYKFRRCFVDEDENASASLSHRMFLHSSGPSSTGSDSPYEHSSDTSSDTVSEMSIDSSSDRSSIISLDDSLDLAFSKRLYGDHSWDMVGSFNVRLYRQQLLQQARNSNSSNVRRVWPKECNGSFARAFSLFSEDPKSKDRQQISKGRWKPANSKSVTTNCTLSQAAKDIRKRSVELMREENGNLVVIREVENGKYSRFSEVKCESLQSRIRKLQVKS